MKKFLTIFGITLLAIIAMLYISFLFVLPKVVDLNEYKPMIQQLAKEQGRVNVDFSGVKLVTTPALEAGLTIYDPSVNLPDNSKLFSADTIKLKLSLPALLTLTVRVSEAVVWRPEVNLDIADGKQYKVVKLIEDIVNSQKTDFSKVESGSNNQMPINPAWIKIVVPNFALNNYKISINDYKNHQDMVLKGDKFAVGYFNGKKAKLKADTQLLVDGYQKVDATVELDSFIPKIQPALDEEDDPTQRLEIPFVNPIDLYKTYDLKTNLAAKIKIRERKGKIALFGFANIYKLTLNLSGYQLPNSYMRCKFDGHKAAINTDLYITPEQHIKSIGKLGFGKRAFADMQISTTKIKFNDLIILTKAILDTFSIPNNLQNIVAQGYFEANTEFKTNFKKLKSKGFVVAKDGGLADKRAGLLIKDGNVAISLDNNTLDIQKASVIINGAELKAQGKISDKAISDIKLYTNGLPLRELYNTFAPNDLKQQFSLNSGLLSLDIRLQGELKKARAFINANLKNFAMSEKQNAFALSNEDLDIRIDSQFPALDGVITNKSFRFNIPSTSSSLYLPLAVVNMDENDIEIMRAGVKLNNSSIINFNGNIMNYAQKPHINFNADGRIASNDLKMLAGKDAAPFLDGNGAMPLRTSINGTLKKLSIIFQVMTNGSNYFTPVTFAQLKDKQNIIQFCANYKGNRIKIKDTGIYSKPNNSIFSDDLSANFAGAMPVVSLTTTITRLDSEPYINLLRIVVPKSLTGNIYALPKSSFKLDRTMLFAFGDAIAPKLRGQLRIFDIALPELLTTISEARTDLRGRRLIFNVDNILVNDSDFNINGNINLNRLPLVVFPELNINSNSVDVNKLLPVSAAAMKLAPPQTSKPAKAPAPVNIPIVVQNGNINFKSISAPPIVATNTTGRITLQDNIFHINNLHTSALGGAIRGNVNMNLANSLLGINVHGENFDVENALLVLANMTDALSGNASFDTDITIDAAAATQADQMKSLKGNVDFVITNGQLGPFGRIENLILAENIRNSKFFETTIGSVVKSITTIETSHFDVMNGHLEFLNGIVNIKPITTMGNVLCVHIAGNMNLLTNDADMKLRARMGSQFSNLLGPLAAINPINLVKVTPGLNVMAAQAFQFFCESITLDEMNTIPDFSKEFSTLSTTKFQVVLRGNLEKPLSMIKSFKWLALNTDIEAAESFVSSLPDPSIVEDPTNATYEQIMAAKAEQEALQAKEDAKLINRVKKFFNREKN